MNKRKWAYILGLLLIAFGIVLIVSPEGVFETIVLIAGIVLIVYASFGIIVSIVNKNPTSSYLIGSSIIGLVFGIILVTNTESATKVIPILLGIWLFLSGLTTTLFMLKSGKTIKQLINPLAKTILGLICFITPIIPITIAGIFIGVVLILSGITTMTNIKNDEVVYKVKVKK